MEQKILVDPVTDEVYYLLDSYSLEMRKTTEQRISELQNMLNDKLESQGHLSLIDYFEIIIEDWPEEEKIQFRMRHIDPEVAREHGWAHKIGDVEYAFLQVRTDLADSKGSIIMLEPFPIPDLET